MTRPDTTKEQARRTTFDRLDLALLAVVALVVCWVQLGDFVFDARPTHFDEWRNAGRMRHLLDSGRLALPSPATGYADLDEDIAHRNLQAGYVVAGGALIRGLGLDVVKHHKLLALLGLQLLIAGVYALSRALADGRAGPPLAVLLLALLPTNVNLLGPAYAVPVVPSLGLICLFLAAWLAEGVWVRAWRVATMLGVTLTLSLTYPLTAVFLAGLVTMAVLARPRAILRPGRALAGAGLVLCLAAVFGLAAGPQRPDGAPLIGWAVEQLTFLDRWHLHRFYAFPLSYLMPAVVLVAALPGAGLACRRRADVVAWAFGLPLAAWFCYTLVGYGFGLPYQRLGLFLGVFAAVLAAMAVAAAANWAQERWAALGAGALIAGFLALAWFGQARPESVATLEHVRRPSPSVLETLRWIEQRRYPPETRVHAHPAAAPYVQALTGLRPSDASIDALLNGRGLALFRCEETYDLVVGLIQCESYRAVFASRGVAVYEPAPP